MSIVYRLSFVLAVLFLIHPANGAEALKTVDITLGSGTTAERGSDVTVHYTGWLLDGTKFDSSLDRDKPFTFTIGEGNVIPGWELGVRGMKVGGKRELIIPPYLGYGKRGAGGVIPGNATLKFEVELLDVKLPKYTNLDNAALMGLLTKGTKIVDIRRPEEWKKTGVVAGSTLLTFFNSKGKVNPNFMDKFSALAGPKDDIILICRTGSRTQAISKFLSERMGYEKINNVTDGITRWIKEGLPVTKATMPEDCWLCKG
ncbi:FKBP-type peptidyl-prolyl cis-trans isomerase [Magnetospira sp. QH-2]|uniref:FKBP-type peptidyl-prolyl cis-trans isomerase n=1 Tax=Magnetospira sp. (strain QH-2) TaxID=1288970 RepID=UPI0003E81046|nr:FKBP-type peptidyl-prolyl cis-trans isomerase [Magnetospira sp. QH-2]CCQ73519.1 Putative peptidyl-prolyl cis-trans isomerase [Magnetospira sp. QH-2]